MFLPCPTRTTAYPTLAERYLFIIHHVEILVCWLGLVMLPVKLNMQNSHIWLISIVFTISSLLFTKIGQLNFGEKKKITWSPFPICLGELSSFGEPLLTVASKLNRCYLPLLKPIQHPSSPCITLGADFQLTTVVNGAYWIHFRHRGS